MGITNALRRIRNAWHFYHALISVIKVACGNIVLRCSPLKRALALGWNQRAKVLMFIGLFSQIYT
ncbi:DUF3265 domain-containing protein [Vibrio parahaemolyticus]|nr:DUF3265 domain-containing protein [Vibrio parahaemolyticus]